MKLLNISIPERMLPDDISTITGASWEVATYPDFNISNYILGSVYNSKTQKVSLNINIDEKKLVNKTIYFRFKLYINNKPQEWSRHIEHQVSGINLPSKSALIMTPEVTVKSFIPEMLPPYGSLEDFGRLDFTFSPFQDVSGMTEFHKAYVTLKASSGEVMKEVVYEASQNRTPENSFLLVNYKDLDDNNVYSLSVTYEGKNNIKSPTKNYLLETYLSDGYLTGKLISVPKKGAKCYAKIDIKSVSPKKSRLRLIDKNDVVVTEGPWMVSTVPEVTIPLDVTSVDGYKMVAELELMDGTITPATTVGMFLIKDNVIRPINPDATYKDEYSYFANVDEGGITILYAEQTMDGKIPVIKYRDRTINGVKSKAAHLILKDYDAIDGYIETDDLTDEEENYEFPLDINVGSEDVFNGIANVTINNLYNGGFVVTSVTRVASQLGYKRLNFMIFDTYGRYQGSTYLDNVGGLGRNGSIFVNKKDEIYFIPDTEYDSDHELKNLSLYKLSLNGYLISKVKDLPFNSKEHVSMSPTANPNNFIILNGSSNRYVVDGKYTWRRDNKDIFLVETETNVISNLGIDTSILPNELYNIHASVRKDGKIIIFNCSPSGSEIANQNSYILDLEEKTIVKKDNDIPDDMIYRNTVRLASGEFLRTSSDVNKRHRMYRYVGDNLEDIVPPVEDVKDKQIVIQANDIKTIDNMSSYELIEIEGTSMEDTGKLISVDPSLPGEFYYDTLIISNDVTLTKRHQDRYDNIIVINSSKVTVEDPN